MQNWDGCNSLGTEETVRLKDIRDGNVYSVAKLKDGKCWMTENLRIVGKEISSEDSDVNSPYAIPTSTLWTDGDINSNYAYYDHNIAYGAYYTYYTATAGSGTSDMTQDGQNAPDSICPRGWRLPTGGSNGEFQQLYQQYNSLDLLTNTPIPAFTYAGGIGYNNGVVTSQGTGGFYWSSTVNSNTNAYYLRLTSDSIPAPANKYPRSGGFSVRCLALDSKSITDLHYLQDWGDLTQSEKISVLKSMESEKNYTLTDKRDDNTYTIAKLKDGKVWMTENLRIGDSKLENRTLDSISTDMQNEETFVLPPSSTSGFNNYDTPYIYVPDSVSDDYKREYGGYYSWFTATVGTGTKNLSYNENAVSSICPKGWKLPTGNYGGDFDLLIKMYGGGTDETTNNALRANPGPNFVLPGFYDNSSASEQGDSGRYWSSTTYGYYDTTTSYNAYRLGLSKMSVDLPNAGTGYYRGISVRCVAHNK